jgi:hypothetical protein
MPFKKSAKFQVRTDYYYKLRPPSEHSQGSLFIGAGFDSTVDVDSFFWGQLQPFHGGNFSREGGTITAVLP